MDSWQDDERLRRYLLGSLPDDEAERLDEAGIADDHLAARLQAVEHDLVDEYVSGALDAPTRERFESVYLASPLRRENVRRAKRFLATVDRAAARTAAVTPSTVLRPEPVRRRAVPLWAAAAVFASVVIASAVLFFSGSHDGSPRATPVATLASRETATASATQVDRDVVVLAPDARSAQALPTVSVKGVRSVRFDLQLESRDFASYAVALRNAAGRVVWRESAVQPTGHAGGSVVAAAVPVDVLRPDRYSFELAGIRADARPDPVATYTIQIAPR